MPKLFTFSKNNAPPEEKAVFLIKTELSINILSETFKNYIELPVTPSLLSK